MPPAENGWEYNEERHSKTMERVFESIHDLHLIITKSDAVLGEVKKTLDEMRSTMNGEGGRQGLVGMVGGIKAQLIIQWVLILGSYGFTLAVLMTHMIAK